jgi:hypothetical protein
MTKAVLVLAALVFVALIVLAAFGWHGLLSPLLTIAALAILIGGGNLLYGKNSHGAAAQARVRPAQQAQNRAIDEARRQAAARRHPVEPGDHDRADTP